jgi:hypothetical protein
MWKLQKNQVQSQGKASPSKDSLRCGAEDSAAALSQPLHCHPRRRVNCECRNPQRDRKNHGKTIDIYRWYQNIDLFRISKVSTCLFWGCYMGIGMGVGEYDREFDVSGVGWYIASEMLLKPPWFSSDTPDSHQKCWWKTRKRDAVELHIITPNYGNFDAEDDATKHGNSGIWCAYKSNILGFKLVTSCHIHCKSRPHNIFDPSSGVKRLCFWFSLDRWS